MGVLRTCDTHTYTRTLSALTTIPYNYSIWPGDLTFHQHPLNLVQWDLCALRTLCALLPNANKSWQGRSRQIGPKPEPSQGKRGHPPGAKAPGRKACRQATYGCSILFPLLQNNVKQLPYGPTACKAGFKVGFLGMLSPNLQKIVRHVKLCSLGMPWILQGDSEDIQEKDPPTHTKKNWRPQNTRSI